MTRQRQRVDYVALAHRVKDHRLNRNLSLRDFAAYTGISASTLSRIERVEPQSLSLDSYATLCGVLGLELSTFAVTGKVESRPPDTVESLRAALNNDTKLRPRARDELFKCFHIMYEGFVKFSGPK